MAQWLKLVIIFSPQSVPTMYYGTVHKVLVWLAVMCLLWMYYIRGQEYAVIKSQGAFKMPFLRTSVNGFKSILSETFRGGEGNSGKVSGHIFWNQVVREIKRMDKSSIWRFVHFCSPKQRNVEPVERVRWAGPLHWRKPGMVGAWVGSVQEAEVLKNVYPGKQGLWLYFIAPNCPFSCLLLRSGPEMRNLFPVWFGSL